MAEHVQGPDQSSRPAAAFVIDGDNMPLRSETGAGEQLAQALGGRQFAGGGFDAGDEFAGLDQERTGHVVRQVHARLADRDQQQAFVGQGRFELFRFDDQGQAILGHELVSALYG